MTDGYFKRVAQLTPTRFWINNPTMEEADKALEAGALACTTNPTYSAKMLRSSQKKEYVMKIMDAAIMEAKNDSEAAGMIQRGLIARLAEKFKARYESNPGQAGFVSIQCDPHAEEDPRNIIREAQEDIKLGKNIIAKIPVTAAGLEAIEYLAGENVPVIATEVMGISQAIAVGELYRKVERKTGAKPPLYITHITGIFDDYMKIAVERDSIDISRDILWQAGCAVARKQYHVLRDRGYHGIMLGGGARGLHHFTEFVGGAMHVTINWQGSADKLLESDPPVVYRIDTPVPEYVIRECMEKIPDFRKAYMEDGLKVDEFMDYGPVELFRSQFIRGWDEMLAAIRERRANLNAK